MVDFKDVKYHSTDDESCSWSRLSIMQEANEKDVSPVKYFTNTLAKCNLTLDTTMPWRLVAGWNLDNHGTLHVLNKSQLLFKIKTILLSTNMNSSKFNMKCDDLTCYKHSASFFTHDFCIIQDNSKSEIIFMGNRSAKKIMFIDIHTNLGIHKAAMHVTENMLSEDDSFRVVVSKFNAHFKNTVIKTEYQYLNALAKTKHSSIEATDFKVMFNEASNRIPEKDLWNSYENEIDSENFIEALPQGETISDSLITILEDSTEEPSEDQTRASNYALQPLGISKTAKARQKQRKLDKKQKYIGKHPIVAYKHVQQYPCTSMLHCIQDAHTSDYSYLENTEGHCFTAIIIFLRSTFPCTTTLADNRTLLQYEDDLQSRIISDTKFIEQCKEGESTDDFYIIKHERHVFLAIRSNIKVSRDFRILFQATQMVYSDSEIAMFSFGSMIESDFLKTIMLRAYNIGIPVDSRFITNVPQIEEIINDEIRRHQDDATELIDCGHGRAADCFFLCIMKHTQPGFSLNQRGAIMIMNLVVPVGKKLVDADGFTFTSENLKMIPDSVIAYTAQKLGINIHVSTMTTVISYG
jgi:hypothetical protein